MDYSRVSTTSSGWPTWPAACWLGHSPAQGPPVQAEQAAGVERRGGGRVSRTFLPRVAGGASHAARSTGRWLRVVAAGQRAGGVRAVRGDAHALLDGGGG